MDDWFAALVAEFQQRESLVSVEAYIAEHAPPAESHVVTRHRRSASLTRNDVRSSATPTGAGSMIPFPSPSVSIFADIKLHAHAAATIISASQKKSGFNVAMGTADGAASQAFRKYLDDFVAPHWFMAFYKHHDVKHESSNHSKFVRDLIAIVLDGLAAAGGNPASKDKIRDSITSLAERVSTKSTTEEKQTLFSSFIMERTNETDPVIYGIFFTTIHVRHVQARKAEVLSATTTTYSMLLQLNSGLLIANADLYDRLARASVGDWIDGHNF